MDPDNSYKTEHILQELSEMGCIDLIEGCVNKGKRGVFAITTHTEGNMKELMQEVQQALQSGAPILRPRT